MIHCRQYGPQVCSQYVRSVANPPADLRVRQPFARLPVLRPLSLSNACRSQQGLMACLFWTVPRDSKLLAALLVSDPDGAYLLACEHVPNPPSLVPAHPQLTSLPRSG